MGIPCTRRVVSIPSGGYGKRVQLAAVRDFAIVPLLDIANHRLFWDDSQCGCTGCESIPCTIFLTSLAIFPTGMRVARISIYHSTQKHYRDSIIRYLACFGSLFIRSHCRHRYFRHRSCNLWILWGKIKKSKIYFIRSN